MMLDEEAKAIIREGWSNPERVDGWIASQLNREFAAADTRAAWVATMRDAIGDRASGAALDIGTGPGTLAQLWAEIGCATTGLDFSPSMLEAGRRAADARGLPIRYVLGDAETPPFPDSSFDLVSSRFVIFTLVHPGYALRRWMELLRPEGYLVFVGHDHPTEPRQHHRGGDTKWKAPKRHREALDHLPFVNHTPKELVVVMEAVGLRDIRRITMNGVVSARAALAAALPDAEPLAHVPFVLVGRK